MSSAAQPRSIGAWIGPEPADDPVASLTPREREVIALMAQGLANAAISARLFITQKTLERHVSSIFAKFDLPVDNARHRRVCAVLAYLRSPLSRARLTSVLGGP